MVLLEDVIDLLQEEVDPLIEGALVNEDLYRALAYRLADLEEELDVHHQDLHRAILEDDAFNIALLERDIRYIEEEIINLKGLEK